MVVGDEGKMEGDVGVDGEMGHARRSCQRMMVDWDFFGMLLMEVALGMELVVDDETADTTDVEVVVRVEGTGALKRKGVSMGGVG